MDIRSHEKVERGSINNVKAKVETWRATFKVVSLVKKQLLWLKKANIFRERL